MKLHLYLLCSSVCSFSACLFVRSFVCLLVCLKRLPFHMCSFRRLKRVMGNEWVYGDSLQSVLRMRQTFLRIKLSLVSQTLCKDATAM